MVACMKRFANGKYRLNALFTDTTAPTRAPGYNSDPTAYEPYTGRNAILLGEYHDIWNDQVQP